MLTFGSSLNFSGTAVTQRYDCNYQLKKLWDLVRLLEKNNYLTTQISNLFKMPKKRDFIEIKLRFH